MTLLQIHPICCTRTFVLRLLYTFPLFINPNNQCSRSHTHTHTQLSYYYAISRQLLSVFSTVSSPEMIAERASSGHTFTRVEWQNCTTQLNLQHPMIKYIYLDRHDNASTHEQTDTLP